MKEISLVGIDIAKDVFQINAVDARGKVVLCKRIYRSDLRLFVTNLPKCVIAMEACSGSNYWGREFEKMGHEVRLISPQFVKPYVKGNKHDAADAEGISEAASRPGMRFVPVKATWQQDILMVHRVRERLVRNRTALTNEIRAVLMEYGVVFGRGYKSLREGICKLMGEDDIRLTELIKGVIWDLYEELIAIQEQVDRYEAKVREIYKSNETCQRIGEVPGVGPVTATAMISSIGDARVFRSGRQMAAWLGLVPRQHSSGGKTVLLGISKRGDRYVRRLLVHGARSVLKYAVNKSDRRSKWLLRIQETRGYNKACVAMANKNARICWALMVRGTEYKAVA